MMNQSTLPVGCRAPCFWFQQEALSAYSQQAMISLYSLSGIRPSTVVTSVSVFFLSLVLVSSGPVVAAQAGVSLVEDNISHIADKVINSQALEEDADEVNWERTWLLRLSVVSTQYWARCFGLFLFSQDKVEVANLVLRSSIAGTVHMYLVKLVVVNSLLLLGGSEVFGGRGGGWHGCQCRGGCCWSTRSPGPRSSGHHGGSSIPVTVIAENWLLATWTADKW